MTLFWLGMIWSQWRLTAAVMANRETCLLSVLFLISFSTFGRCSIEISPEIVAGLALSTILILGERPLSGSYCILMGLLSGIAFFIAPKILFPVGGYWVGLWVYHRTPSKTYRPELFLAGALVPIVTIVLYEWQKSALYDFYHCFLLLNARIDGATVGISCERTVRSIIENPVLWTLAFFGLWKRWRTPHGWAFITAMAGIPFGVTSSYEKYFLLLAPILCLYAAGACADLLTESSVSEIVSQSRKGFIAAALAVSVGFQAVPLRFRDATERTITQIRCVMAHTAPNDAIMDTQSNWILFRPCPSYYGRLDPRLKDSEIEQIFLDALNRTECRGVICSPSFSWKYPRAEAYVQTHFHATDCLWLYLRN